MIESSQWSPKATRIGHIALAVFDIAVFALALFFVGVAVAAMWYNYSYDRQHNLHANDVPTECRSIAAVYVAMRCCQLEDTYSPYPRTPKDPLQRLATYFTYDPDNPVPKELIPRLVDYDIDIRPITDPVALPSSTVIIAAKMPDRTTGARLIILADGTMKAIVSPGRLAGRDVADLKGQPLDVTPERGIIK